ncbi:bifunctional 4-hydroxy-2-oxoglutarate aldolase/2-dehydro-3-deoxy-phosphogluconate aldolase [Lactobacillus sp. ESL0791]|uniref:bifunctional 4-hydroxy-2-oxoglutarate aldolase/2-dehydro-3-deoxy-phosphogluconate aldolase n=1 Tax=Lactobacillus sp. ESL0791 TaxID=2983234 RepID=UPI0023F96045|nr:bifunctional 4-hydroxy-2-oxoglutarate aldolase/2-dehydro-3-deoxy-phosphogluconate aldolase [Lactobacillus sp. ESL0791]MDF7638008.1 bifunctional 4-hydroxy-2-oxoglutarate aldolase/2-dehydro-3-deoxy-phosphogluconate aldolase [Lactobacillus sp. ESL0791]
MKVEDYPKFTIILRNYSQIQAHAILLALKGLENEFAVEITLNTPNAFNMIKNFNDEFGEKLIIGAGTVLDFESEKKAVENGAQFLLSSCVFTKEMMSFAKKKKVITVPGVMTPSEAWKMHQYGADIIKIFPAVTVGPAFFKAIKAPLGNLRLMAVGGISSSNIHEFLTNKADYIGIGSGAFKPKDVENLDIERLHASLIDIVHKK